MARITGAHRGDIARHPAAAALAGYVLDTASGCRRAGSMARGAGGLAAAWLYRRCASGASTALLAAEARRPVHGAVFSLGMLRQILRADPAYRRYMFWLGLYGAGNLMVNAQLVILFSDRLHLSSTSQIGCWPSPAAGDAAVHAVVGPACSTAATSSSTVRASAGRWSRRSR